jgi:hypothetical protein
MSRYTPICVACAAITAAGCGMPQDLEEDSDIHSSSSAITINKHTPGGKKYYVFAVTSLAGADEDVVKVGHITFFSSLVGHYYGDLAGRVSWSGWFWRRSAGPGEPGFSGPQGIGTSVGVDCDQTGSNRFCPAGDEFNNGRVWQRPAVGELRAASGYAGSPTEVKNGDYYVVTSSTPHFVHMRWDDGTWEDWNLTTASSGIQRLEWRDSNVGYDAGVAAGSDKPHSTRKHPVHLPNHGSIGFLPLSSMTQCSNATWVLNESHHKSESTSPCSCDPKHSFINNWLARVSSTDRRDLWHSWCQCLAWDTAWYDGGSHQRMMLQAIDDGGAFRGYVGVGVDRHFAHAALYDYLDF